MANAVVARNVAKREVLLQSQELGMLKASHDQTVTVSGAERGDLKVLLANAQSMVNIARYESSQTKTQLQQLKSGQQRY